MKRFFSLSFIPILLMFMMPVTSWAKEAPGKKIQVVKSDSLKMRAAPKKDAKVILSLSKYYPAEVIETKSGWTKVKTRKNTKGWVQSKYLARGPYLSVDGKLANVRAGSKSRDRVLFTLENHYPVKVLEKKDSRVKIVDYEGDEGWIHQSLLTDASYVIVMLKSINLREGPGTQHEKRFTAERGVVFKVLEEKDGWIHVKHADGDEGWCSAKIVWGWRF